MSDIYHTANELGRAADAAKSDDERIKLYLAAWDVAPEPRFAWEGGTWIWNCLAGIYLKQKDYKAALDAARMSEQSHRGSENSNTMMLLGAILLDGYKDRAGAAACFRKADSLSEGRAFSGRPARYRALAKGMIASAKLTEDIEFRTSGNELPKTLLNKIRAECARGDALLDKQMPDKASKRFARALELLPEPIENWEAFTWIQAAIGDAFFQKGDWATSEDAFRQALKGPSGIGNPFIHLRIGQCAFESDRPAVAVDELLKAYMAEGEDIFAENGKYLDFLRANVEL